jgi:hypothetical protein
VGKRLGIRAAGALDSLAVGSRVSDASDGQDHRGRLVFCYVFLDPGRPGDMYALLLLGPDPSAGSPHKIAGSWVVAGATHSRGSVK